MGVHVAKAMVGMATVLLALISTVISADVRVHGEGVRRLLVRGVGGGREQTAGTGEGRDGRTGAGAGVVVEVRRDLQHGGGRVLGCEYVAIGTTWRCVLL